MSQRQGRESRLPVLVGRPDPGDSRLALTLVVGDASVVIKWQHEKGEAEVAEARALLAAHARGEVELRILDPVLYEVGNVLVRVLRWEAGRAATALDYISSVVAT